MKTKVDNLKKVIFNLMSIEELEKAVKGVIVFNYSSVNAFSSVVIDSRNVEPNSLFIPLRGEKQDGHIYLESALQNGSCCFFVDNEFISFIENENKIKKLCELYSAACISVENNLHALQNLAKYYLEGFPNLYKIGITGSNGKTTTKEILASIYSQKYNTIMNEGNLNSETGLPLSIFKVRPEHEVGIFELGMNRRDEIAELSNVLFPNAAIITNISSAHIGILGTKHAIAEQKKQIFLNFNESCFALIPKCEFTDFLRKNVKGTIEVCAEVVNGPGIKKIESNGFKGFKIFYKTEIISFPLIGEHNIKNAISCILFAERLGFSVFEIKSGLEAVQPLFGRSQLKYGFVSYLLDCYNANPDSTMAAIRFCDSFKFKNDKHFVFASMLELGSESASQHKIIFKRALNSSADKLYFFGDEFACNSEILDSIKNKLNNKTHIFLFNSDEFEKLKNTVESNLKKGDFVLLKGSRSMELERLEPLLQDMGRSING